MTKLFLQSKQTESIKRSPIFEQLDSVLSGLPTIRAWSKSRIYIDRICASIDAHSRCVWHLWLFNRWLGIRFAIVGTIFTVSVASFAVYSPSVSASLAGLALTFSLEFSQCVFWVLRKYADIEMDMNSLERVIEFCNIPTEPADGVVPPAHWPNRGGIEISDLIVGYSPDLPPVLRGITFRIAPNSRVGIVGPTGAGKSSLTMALFRFLEASGGSIRIDGLDISTLNIHALRSHIAIIPQRPVLWQGTIRSNLDPFGKFEDDVELRELLERVQLNQQDQRPSSQRSIDGSLISLTETDEVIPIPATTTTTRTTMTNKAPAAAKDENYLSLSTPIAAGGANVSLGQRQLNLSRTGPSLAPENLDHGRSDQRRGHGDRCASSAEYTSGVEGLVHCWSLRIN